MALKIRHHKSVLRTCYDIALRAIMKYQHRVATCIGNVVEESRILLLNKHLGEFPEALPTPAKATSWMFIGGKDLGTFFCDTLSI